uniref:Uncharacterized protein n=1 Tax=Anguilla anguilla TaxID=7936 RepID=A0A0E9V6T4_ANGAN
MRTIHTNPSAQNWNARNARGQSIRIPLLQIGMHWSASRA